MVGEASAAHLLPDDLGGVFPGSVWSIALLLWERHMLSEQERLGFGGIRESLCALSMEGTVG